MKRTVTALLTSGLLLGSSLLHAESLREIYQLALENDAQLKAERAQFLARSETEELSRAPLLPQIGVGYSYEDVDRDTSSISRDFKESDLPLLRNESNTDVHTDGYTVSLNQALFDRPAWFQFQHLPATSKILS